MVEENGTENIVNIPNDLSFCHVIPDNQTEGMLRSQRKTLCKDQMKQALNDYVNLPHVKSLDKAGMDRNHPKGTHGMILNTSASWNRDNLVFGPNPQRQSGDGEIKLDQAIAGRQSKEFNDRVNDFTSAPSLATFGALPAARPVKYRRNPDPKKNFYVK